MTLLLVCSCFFSNFPFDVDPLSNLLALLEALDWCQGRKIVEYTFSYEIDDGYFLSPIQSRESDSNSEGHVVIPFMHNIQQPKLVRLISSSNQRWAYSEFFYLDII